MLVNAGTSLRSAPRCARIECSRPRLVASAAGAGKGSTSLTKQRIPTSIPDVPITVDRAPADDLDDYIPSPGTPRVNRAASKENPNGNPESPENRTVLQAHIDFWDRDKDGIVWPVDTYVGFRRIGFSVPFSIAAVPIIHGTFSIPSQQSFLPDLRFPLYLDRSHRMKHGSDSEVYDTEGRFVPQKFEDIFAKFDKGNKGALTWSELDQLIKANKNIVDPVGWSAETLEWWATHLLLKDERGLLHKDKIMGVYDGTIWEKLADDVANKRRRVRGFLDSFKEGVQ